MANRKRATPSMEIAAHARSLLRLLAPGQSADIQLPDSRYWRGESRRAISVAATGILGSGWFWTEPVIVEGIESLRVTRRVERVTARLRDGGYEPRGDASV